MVEPVDIGLLKEGFKKLEQRIADEIKKYYRNICPHCLKTYSKSKNKTSSAVIKEISEKIQTQTPQNPYERYHFEEFITTKNIFADTMYYFWIKEVPCLNCNSKVPLFRGYMLAQKRDVKAIMLSVPTAVIFLMLRTTEKIRNVLNAKESSTLIRMEM